MQIILSISNWIWREENIVFEIESYGLDKIISAGQKTIHNTIIPVIWINCFFTNNYLSSHTTKFTSSISFVLKNGGHAKIQIPATPPVLVLLVVLVLWVEGCGLMVPAGSQSAPSAAALMISRDPSNRVISKKWRSSRETRKRWPCGSTSTTTGTPGRRGALHDLASPYELRFCNIVPFLRTCFISK